MNIEFSKRAERFGSNIFNILNEKKNDRLAQGKPVYNFTVEIGRASCRERV